MKNPFKEIEEKVLDFWEKNKIFEKSIETREGKPVFSFYDGPPFASGPPHYGHILASSIKDTVLRYKTMNGFKVPRRVGWDCHGLPIENLIEKELNIKTKKEIEELGIEKFNEACRDSVFRCVDQWKTTLKRVGRWADYENDYATLSNDYIESVWWVLKELYDKGLVYKDYRVTPYCPRCETPVSNFEVNQGYADVEDSSVFIRFKILTKGKFKDSSIIAWTTTPWTLPGNVALVVDPKSIYVLLKEKEEKYIVLKNKISLFESPEVIEELKGSDLVGLEYEPPFSYLKEQAPEGVENAFRVYSADFVDTEEGTGIVHTAVMYGEDDFQLGKLHNLPFSHSVDESGAFSIGKWKGRFVKDVEKEIIEDLKSREILFKEEKIRHSYPFCWRCDTPLLYYALHTWYIKVTEIKEKLISNNEKIHWIPEHIKSGRFGKWLEGAKDWAFSRNRFWGAPIPIWECNSCGEKRCIGKKEDLGKELKDLHRPFVDEIVFPCSCGGEMKRTEEVFDCWFESGSMPYAQWHYPFENKELVEETFPADFIAEGADQTRGWFYTLHVIATALTTEDIGLGKDSSAFKNVINHGLVLDSTGKKLSKKLRNYPEVDEVFSNYGADSLRYFLLSSTAIGEDYLFSAKGVEGVWRRIISTLWHSYSFFATYKEKNFKPDQNFRPRSDLNKWMISRLNSASKETVEWMEKYDLTKASRPFEKLIDDLSNWYIRRSRRKFQKSEDLKAKEEASQTLYRTLLSVCKLMAPFTPFITEHIYQELSKLQGSQPESVHLCDYPQHDEKSIDSDLESVMEKAREIAAIALAQRSAAGIKIRQPLQSLKIKDEKLAQNEELLNLIKEEVNVREIVLSGGIKEDAEINTTISEELKEEGIIRELIRQVQEARKSGELTRQNKIEIYLKGSPKLQDLVHQWEKTILFDNSADKIFFKESPKVDAEREVEIDKEKVWIGILKIK